MGEYLLEHGTAHQIHKTVHQRTNHMTTPVTIPTHASSPFKVIDYLDRHGYDCFWAGRQKLWRVTGCFDGAWDSDKQWSNLACALRVDRCWQAAMAPFVQNASHLVV